MCASSSCVVVVADDEVDDRLLRVARDPVRVDVALAILGRLGREPVGRERSDELGRELDGVHELALRGAGMDREPVDRHAHRSRRERLDLDLAETRAVERVGDLRPESVEIEVLRPAPDLLVDRERDADRCATPLGRPREIGDRRHDLGDAGLVVGAEERRAVARHDVVTDPLGQRRQLLGIEDLARVARELDALSSPRPMDDRRDPGAGDVRRRVHVRDEADDGRAVLAGQAGEDRRAVVQLRVLEPERAKLLDEHAREVELLLRARSPADAVRALRVDLDVAQEAVEDVVRELGRERARERRASQAVRAADRSRGWRRCRA